MRMMLVGAGAVGESIVKVMQWRDPKGEWLEYVLVCDYDKARAQEVVDKLSGDTRFEAEKVNATDREDMKNLIKAHKIDFVMDGAPPFASNMILTQALPQVSITAAWAPGLCRWMNRSWGWALRTATQNQ